MKSPSIIVNIKKNEKFGECSIPLYLSSSMNVSSQTALLMLKKPKSNYLNIFLVLEHS